MIGFISWLLAIKALHDHDGFSVDERIDGLL